MEKDASKEKSKEKEKGKGKGKENKIKENLEKITPTQEKAIRRDFVHIVK